MQSNPTLEVSLNRDGVAAPVMLAALVSTDVIAASLTAFADGELQKPTMPNQFPQLQIDGPEITSHERRQMYENWLLSKGFQDLARGVRDSLEEAALYIRLVSGSVRVRTSATLEEMFDSFRKPIAKLNFPDLLAKVNAGLSSRLQFEQEFRSIQKVRNCLEHRGGIVRKQDLDEGANLLTLSFPRMKIFYMRGENEIEIARDKTVDAEDGKPEVQILGRLVPRSKTYSLGERVTFSAQEFSEIAMACSFFGQDLASKLPISSYQIAVGELGR